MNNDNLLQLEGAIESVVFRNDELSLLTVTII